MRYAVLSDIHSNGEALTAVLDFLSGQKIDAYLCLGDIIGYGADPIACLKRLKALNAVMVAGNHEYACIGRLDDQAFNLWARDALRWTRDQLGILDLDTLRRLPLTTVHGPFTLVHSALHHPERFTYLTDPGRIVETLGMCRTLFCLAGHTHVPCVAEYDFSKRRLMRMITQAAELDRIAFVNDSGLYRYYVNPGSVGQPRDGDPRASVAVIDAASCSIQLHRVPYAVSATQEKIRRAGLPAFLADRLSLGR